ncbi:MAG: S8 family serine peptidase [Cellulosilyticaceae bacterium]
MNINKLSGITQMALLYSSIISPNVFEILTGQKLTTKRLYIVVQHQGDLSILSKKYEFSWYDIGNGFSYVYIEKKMIDAFSEEMNIIFIEIPETLDYILNDSINAICISQSNYTAKSIGVKGDLTGKGVIVGIIDSGIDYFHKDFRKPDGTTRILNILELKKDELTYEDGNRKTIGKEYTSKEINRALKKPDMLSALQIVPVKDIVGHGTAIASIAAGNGYLQNGKYKGIAPESELIIVKVGSFEGEDEWATKPNSGQIMIAIQYILKKAIEYQKPVSLAIGFGSNQGLHNGQGSLEVYMDRASNIWKNNIVVGAGNQANKDSHTNGFVKNAETKVVSVFLDQNQIFYFFNVVYGMEDTISIEIKAPNGETTGKLTQRRNNHSALLNGNSLIINFSGPNGVSNVHNITVLMDKYDQNEVATGIWEVILYGDTIVTGSYNIWGTSLDPVKRVSRFIEPNPDQTLTVPSTSRTATSVGAFDSRTLQIAPFTGRGFTINKAVKPEILAPGVSIVAATSSNISENGYAAVTGTSAASAFVAGGYALLLQYGLDNKPNGYLYGEALKAFMIKGANRPFQGEPYPNNVWGYGMMCIENTVQALKEQYGL